VIAAIRSSALQGYVPLVRELGGDPAALLRRVRLPEATLANPEAYIPYATLVALIEDAAAELDRPDFGLRLARRQGIEVLGPIAVIARHSATVQEALTRIAQHLHVHSPAIAIAVDPLGGAEARFTFSILAPGQFPRAQAYELAVGLAARIMRVLIGSRFRPLRAAIPHAPLSAPRVYRDFFEAEVQFEQDHCGFDLPRTLLAMPLQRSDPEVRDIAVRFLQTHHVATDDLEARVRHLILKLLPTGHCSIETAAAHLGVHSRTLQRHLAGAGTSFEYLVEAVRRERAAHYLGASTLQMSQIAATLGYTEQSSFSRSCRRWFGQPPRAVRARARQSAPAGSPRR
jgi:AraC-like DNA-binding protein